jgi:hypothetical protein
MSEKVLVRISASTAAEVCANFDLPNEARKLLGDNMNPQEFVSALIVNKKCLDAIDFMAHALPSREGIWWGCLCMQHALGNDLPPVDRDAAIAAVQWVMSPTEQSRIRAKAPSELAGSTSLAGTLARAAFLSGGNVAPPNAPHVEPPPFSSAKAVARAVKLAAMKVEPPHIPKVQRSYVELAMEVAEGRLI